MTNKLRQQIVDTTIIIPSSGVVNCVESENGPGPTAVSACTWNSYTVSGAKWDTHT